MASLAINPFNNNQVQTSNLTRSPAPGPQEDFGGYFSGRPSAPSGYYGYETFYNPWGGNPNQDPNMAWYNQTIKPGLDEATRIFYEAERRLDNYGFNAETASSEKDRRALELLTANDNAVLKKLDTMGKGDRADQKVSSRDIEAALRDHADQFTPEELAALKWMYEGNGGKLWDDINGADSKATFKEINNAKV